MYKHHTLRETKQEKKNDARAHLKRKIILYTFWIIVFAVLISLSSRLNYFKLTNITVSGNEAVVDSEVQDFIFQLTKEKSSLLIQRSSLFFIPKRAIHDGLLNKYARLKSVEIGRDFPNSIIVTVTEHESDVVWCKNLDSECFFIDREGILLDQSPYFSGDAYFRIYHDSFSGVTGENIFSSQEIANINSFRALLSKELRLTAHSMRVPSPDTFEFSLLIPLRTLDDSPQLLIANNFEPRPTILNILTIINDPVFLAKYSKHPEGLEYIDLRFGNKVYYKFKE